MNRVRLFLACLLLVSGISESAAQLKVDAALSIQEAITRLVGPGVRVTNVRVNCPSGRARPYGYFTDNTGTLDISDGLVITTGAARNAEGPNNSASVSQSNGHDLQDPDLATLVQVNEKQFDACIIEFDVEVFADTLTFDYVFGSEEYLEFIRDYHDVFGFFISGPGIPGRRNLAVLPGSGASVSVANVNTTRNPSLYIDNGTGSTPFDNLFVQYDGFTRRLVSRVAVIPCQRYRLKLAICDIKDDIYDAGIFIAGKSLRTKAPVLRVRYEHPRFPTALEGCNGAFVKIVRQSRISEGITFGLAYSGDAIPGQDYGEGPSEITFLPGEAEKEFFLPVFSDALSEGPEAIVIELLNPCPGLPPSDKLVVPVREAFDFEIPDARMCFGDSVQLNPAPAPGYLYSWQDSRFLSCTTCLQPFAFPPATRRYLATIREPESGCLASDSLEVTVDPIPVAAFSVGTRSDYSSLDAFFQNESRFAQQYKWDFGDGGRSEEISPRHYYQAGFNRDSVSFQVVLTATNSASGCSDTASATLRIENPLFIPTLMTPGPGINRAFFVRGIRPDTWQLEVFNRWGERVFTSDRYDLKWEAQGLESGVYFFLLKNPPADRVYRGWVKVIR